MAIHMALYGGLGIIHCNNTIDGAIPIYAVATTTAHPNFAACSDSSHHAAKVPPRCTPQSNAMR